MWNDVVPQAIAIKAIGFWNRHIFNPDWISTKIIDAKRSNANINMDINPIEQTFKYNFNSISLIPLDNSIELRLEKDQFTRENAIFLYQVFKKIITLLPETPIRGFGLNVVYSLDKKSDLHFIDWFNNMNCELKGFTFNNISLKKQKKDHHLNLIVTDLENTLKLNFNFHFDKLKILKDDIFIDFINISYKEIKYKSVL